MVGHSTGALIGNYLVCEDPRRFRRVVSLDPVPPQSLPFDEKARAFFAAAQRDQALARWAIATAASSLFDPASLDSPGEPVFQGTATEEQRTLFERVVRQACEASPGVWLGIPAVLDRLRAQNDLLPRVASLAQPHLIIQGSDDRIIPLAEVKAMTTILPSAKLKILDGIGHSPNLEAPADFSELVTDFLLS
jgi:pimeloyl-ACP methyl ester carboxylesterase